MNKFSFRSLALFAGLVLFQALVLNNVNIGGMVNPQIYPLFILALPIGIPGWLLLVLSFLMGICVDMFSNTLGIHAASLVLMAFCRPLVINIITPKGGYENGHTPSASQYGLQWFVFYSFLLLMIHHFAFFNLEAYSTAYFGQTLLKIFSSLLVSELLVLLISLVMYHKKKW